MPAETAQQDAERLEAAAGRVFPDGTGEESSNARLSSAAQESPKSGDAGVLLRSYFEAMSKQLGPMNWWPANSVFEVIVGAILTQNTAWTNVKLALANLRRERLLTVRAISRVGEPRLAELIRPSGYYRQKAKRLKAFVAFLECEYGGSLRRMSAAPTAKLREQLLAVHGIGPETADSILLYAAEHPVFVVDAYTKRLVARHSVMHEEAKYTEVQALFMRHLPREAKLYNEYHALIVNVGKKWCRAREARCRECPLGKFLPANVQGLAPLTAIEVRA
jgi:endonuclease III related protein